MRFPSFYGRRTVPASSSLAALAALLMAGCSIPIARSRSGSWAGESPSSWAVGQGGSIHRASTLESVLADEGEALPRDPGPKDYVQAALQRNPAILAAQRQVDRLLERIPQARSLEDPRLNVTPLGEMADTAAGEVGWMSSVSQKLPFAGKRKTRAQVAAQEVAMATAALDSVRLRIVSDTRKAYWGYYYACRAIEVIHSDQELLRRFQQNAEAKLRVGTGTQQDVLRASVELSNLDNELITLEQRKQTAVALLNSLLDRPVTAPLPEPKEVELERIAVELDRLLHAAALSNPGIRRIQERIQQYRERLKLARLDRWPDLTLGLSYNSVDDRGLAPSADGTDQWWVTFGFNIPLWLGRLDAAEREADAGIWEGVSELTAERNRIAFLVQDAFVRLDTQQRLVLLLRDVIVPQAVLTVDASESGYQAGSLDFLTLMDNWRKLLDFRLMLHRSLTQLEQDFAGLQEVVGQDLVREKVDLEQDDE